MAERSVGRRATRRRSIEPARVQAPGRIVDGSVRDEVLANDRGFGMPRPNDDGRTTAADLPCWFTK
jgi:hypothetical protein